MITLEHDIRFSQANMWRNQRDYYHEKGINAWHKDVPSYITSNPYIAKHYAQMVITFIEEWVKQHPEGAQEPFYFLELGAGSGQFTAYFLKSFFKLQKALSLDHIQISYVMSDVTSVSFDFWEKHAAFQPYIASGVLDFSIYDLYHDTEIHLYRSRKTITSAQLINPLIVIGNYIFDTIATDIFTVENGELYEEKVSFVSPEDNLQQSAPKRWDKVIMHYHRALVKEAYYHNALDKILFDYQKNLVDTHFQFPIAVLNALARFKTLSRDRFLLVSSDKAYTSLEELDHCDYPALEFHGSFSVMVNYHAVREFLNMNQGDSLLQPFRRHISTGAFACGFQFSDFPRFKLVADSAIHAFTATDYFILYDHFVSHPEQFPLEVIASYLNLSQWDAYLFDLSIGRLSDLTDKGDPEVIAFLCNHMTCIADNFYYLPNATDTFFNIGLFFQNCGRYTEALPYYQRSLQQFGDHYAVFFNMGMCYHSLHQQAEAVRCLEKSLDCGADPNEIKTWVSTVSTNPEDSVKLLSPHGLDLRIQNRCIICKVLKFLRYSLFSR
ncbi:MAG: hypothetical protein A3E84_05705 [Gammaproteobacteria bacterium RIFCSPHIGHO2_12_FULL_42_13]|nr:MAG: hypothetical protein A3E84_05705 [Gammaproteobacteria bacterium RIFCSPHIGHO2_12_FULL_42_13]